MSTHTTEAQHSVDLAQIAHLLDEAGQHEDYARSLHARVGDKIKEAFPIGCIVVSENGTRSIVTGHHSDRTFLFICNLGSSNACTTKWTNVRRVIGGKQ